MTQIINASGNIGRLVSQTSIAILVDSNGNVIDNFNASGGDVVGPSTSTNNDLVTFNGSTGKLVKDTSSITALSGALVANPFTIATNPSIFTNTLFTLINDQVSINSDGAFNMASVGASMQFVSKTNTTISSAGDMSIASLSGINAFTSQNLNLSGNLIRAYSNVVPTSSGINNIGTRTLPFSEIFSSGVITRSPNGLLWKLTVDNNGIVTGVLYS